MRATHTPARPGRLQLAPSLGVFWVAALAVLLSQALSVSAQSLTDGLVLVSPEGRQTIRTFRTRQRTMVALDELAGLFGLRVEEDDGARTATISAGDEVIILTEDQQLASVAGRLVSMRTAPRRADGEWLVPLEFLNRALAPILGETIAVRERSGLVLIGEVTVPRVASRYRAGTDEEELSFEVTPSVPHAVRQEGNHLVVRFEADALDFARPSRLRGDLVTSISAHPSEAELLVDLGPAFDTFSVSSQPTTDGGTEVRIGLTPRARVTDAAPTASPPPPANGLRPADAGALDIIPELGAAPTVRVVAIDAGHGGNDVGTRSGPDDSAALEKDVALSVARRLRDAIQQRLGLRVVLTRNRDESVPMDQRAEVANNNKADLFISLHVNASVRPSATGAEVFYLSLDEYGAEARELAQRDTQLVPVLGGGLRAIDLVEWDLAQVRYLEGSARLADIVHQELSRRIPMSPRDVQEAPFRVLVGANMPAVLVEMGFISNPEDARRLTSARFQNAVVDALIDSILRFRTYVETTGGPMADATEIDVEPREPESSPVRDE